MEDKQYKYNCKQCNFSCQYKSLWEKHIQTEIHKTGKRKIRSDVKDSYKCQQCEYQSKNIFNFRKHVLNAHSNKETREKRFKYYCKYCDFGTFSKTAFSDHNETNRHKLVVKRNE